MRLVLLFPALVIMVLLAAIFTITADKVMRAVQNPQQVQPITGLVAAKQGPDVKSLIKDPRGFANLTEEASASPLP